MKRIFLIVLDSLGAGALPDAAMFGDEGAFTIRALHETGELRIPNLRALGLGNIEGISFLGKEEAPRGAYCRIAERSNGKDTTTGHWEIAGIISERPFPTYPNGFPDEIIDKFKKATGKEVICNKPYSGTEVIKDYGEEHLKTGALIVYTSADSVFQIAAHESIVPLDDLYDCCERAREILSGEHGVGRVIARPFEGEVGSFRRTANRRDLSLEPHAETMLDAIKSSGKDVIAVGKISDIFTGRGITDALITHGNDEGMEITREIAKRDFEGLCFVNLVDFDSIYGHRNDATGYALAINEFDKFLAEFLPLLRDEDALVITADHGCDPSDESTDHTREYIPMLAYGKGIKGVDLGTRECFADIAATVCEWLCVNYECPGKSFAEEIENDG